MHASTQNVIKKDIQKFFKRRF